MCFAKYRAVVSCLTIACLLVSISAHAQNATLRGLAAARSLKCTFPLMSTGTWDAVGAPSAEVRGATLELNYDEIDTQDGTAQASVTFGRLHIIARLSNQTLHLLAIDNDGPLYITTVFDRPGHPGRLKATHTRHVFTDVSLPGFPSRPEQYFGECEILRSP